MDTTTTTTAPATMTDRIEKRTVIRAPRTRIWHALTDASEFGTWFGVAFDDAVRFTPDARVCGRITSPGYEHVRLDVTIERVEPESLFSLRWHPNAVEPDRVDYSAEPTTLVVFELADVAEGTLVTIMESGFDAIPLDRRAEAYRGNSEGWAAQLQALARYVGELV